MNLASIIKNLNLSKLTQNPNQYSYITNDFQTILDKIFLYMEKLGYTVDILAVSYNQLKQLEENYSAVHIFDKYIDKEIIETGIYGNLFCADVYISDKLNDNQIITGNISKNKFILNNISYQPI